MNVPNTNITSINFYMWDGVATSVGPALAQLGGMAGYGSLARLCSLLGGKIAGRLRRACGLGGVRRRRCGFHRDIPGGNWQQCIVIQSLKVFSGHLCAIEGRLARSRSRPNEAPQPIWQTNVSTACLIYCLLLAPVSRSAIAIDSALEELGWLARTNDRMCC